MGIRVGINGFGRIGRLVFRAMAERGAPFELVAVNDLADPTELAHLLKYDSAHGKFGSEVKPGNGELTVDGKNIKVLKEREPAKLPWEALGVEVVVESTGFFTQRESDRGGFADHLRAGAKKVIISAPAKDEDLTVVMGVNDDQVTKDHHCISNASCTTNSLAPLAYVLDTNYGIVKGLMTTVHAYTNDQRVNDLIHKDMRRARAAAVNIIPSSTGAAKAIGKVLTNLDGKLDGMALRVPVVDGSVTDLTVELEKDVSRDEVNKAFQKAAEGRFKGVLEYCVDPIVSSDIINNPHSCIFDSLCTMTIPKNKGNIVKVLGWYDNEWGYSNRTADLVKIVGNFL